ncbi:MAG TPA: DUF5330 domain-containing protein [Rhizobiaceae bacterium]|nr:DUF5330 domain-containing protein [Rhizobiaceae bacterium]
MFFLIRTAFWFSLVLLFLPLGGTDGQQVGPLQAFVAARAAITDFSGFCERQPDACATGSAAIQTIGVRAQESVRIASELMGNDDADVSEIDPTAIVEAAHADAGLAATIPDTTILTGTVPTPSPKPAVR